MEPFKAEQLFMETFPHAVEVSSRMQYTTDGLMEELHLV